MCRLSNRSHCRQRLRLGDVADYRSQIESKKLRIYSSAKLKNVTAILPNRLLAAATGIKGKYEEFKTR